MPTVPSEFSCPNDEYHGNLKRIENLEDEPETVCPNGKTNGLGRSYWRS